MPYFDNAATSYPKPPEVVRAMQEAFEKQGGNPGRGGHRLAVAAGELLYETRERTAAFFGCEDPFRVSFTLNITAAINLVLNGMLTPEDHVLVSPLEHNAVMRPLTGMGIPYDILPGLPDGRVDVTKLDQAFRPNTKLVCICHESNVNGAIQPLGEIARAAHRHGALLLADCAQSAGHLPLSAERDGIDFLCFTGHKGLLGPTGTGGVVFGSRVRTEAIRPLTRGGTGSRSESYDQPVFLPDRFESGTQNLIGLAGLNAGIRWLQTHDTAENLRGLTARLRDGLAEIPGLKLYCADAPEAQGSVLSFTLDGVDNGRAAIRLEQDHDIQTRIGLHCAPLAHRTLGTFPSGTIRFGLSPFTTAEDIDCALKAVGELKSGL